MVYNWDTMVAVKVPIGLNGWQNRGTVIINGRKFLFPVGVETMVPEPVAFYIDLMIRLEEESNRPPSAPPENEDDECACVVSIIESASPTAADLGSFSVLGPVRFPNAESVGNYAFQYCTSLTSIDMPVATSIGNYAFNGCTALTSIDLPVATSIGASAFEGCTTMTSIDLPAAESIGNTSLYGCTALTSVDLPAATSIGEAAFYKCANFSALILRTTETVCSVDVTAILGTKIMTAEGVPTGEGFIYIPASMDSAYRAAYEPIFEQLGAPGLYDLLFRHLEDYTVDGTATGKLDESKI